MAPRSRGRLERTRAGAQAPAGGSSGGGGNGRPVLGQSPETSPHTHPGTRKLSGDCHPSRACQHLSGGTKPPIQGQESPRPETGPTHGSRGEPLDHGHGHQTPSTTPSPPGPELPGPSGRPQKRGGRGSRGQPPRAARAGRDRSVPPSESPGQDLEKNSTEEPPATGPGAGPWLPSLSRGSTYASSRPPPTSGQRRDPRNSEREVRSDGPDPPRARVPAGDALPGPPSRAPGAGPRSSPGRDLDKKLPRRRRHPRTGPGPHRQSRSTRNTSGEKASPAAEPVAPSTGLPRKAPAGPPPPERGAERGSATRKARPPGRPRDDGRARDEFPRPFPRGGPPPPPGDGGAPAAAGRPVREAPHPGRHRAARRQPPPSVACTSNLRRAGVALTPRRHRARSRQRRRPPGTLPRSPRPSPVPWPASPELRRKETI